MALPLQANSLSSISELAGNPPRYPRNPTEPKRESLVLYIARVPGSKDVILTTMKPRLKNVTAEDVLTSLYYLHVDGPNDALWAEEVEDAREVQNGMDPRKACIPRKPVEDCESAQELNKGISGNLEASGVSNFTQKSGLAPQQAIPIQKPLLPRRPQSTLPTRRPLGPRPLQSEAQIKTNPLVGDENAPFGRKLQSMAPSVETERERYQSPSNGKSDMASNVNPIERSPHLPYLLRKFPAGEHFSITLIRRNPTSGAQWNIGTISSGPTLDERTQIPDRKPSLTPALSSVSIELTTLGYGKFWPGQAPTQVTEGKPTAAEFKQNQKAQTTFNRQVRMEWSKPWERKYKQQRRGSSDPSGKNAQDKLERNNANLSVPLGRETAEHDNGKQGPECGFLSPWNGQCEFSTGSSGRTLKCKHVVPSSPSVSNPISAVSAAVSELRFNLPAVVRHNDTISSGVNGQESKLLGKSKLSHIRNKLSSDGSNIASSPKPHPTSYAALYPSDEDDDSGEILDLSLGREKAGGGIRGKRVKLGKLIVHDEGLKMLDLVVAANLGIWWTVWDR